MPAQTSAGGNQHPPQTEQQIASSNATASAFLGGRQQPSWITPGATKPSFRPVPPRSAGTLAVQQQFAQSVLPSPAPSDEPSPAMSNPHDSPNANPVSLPDTVAQTMGSTSAGLPVTEARFAPSQPTTSPNLGSGNPGSFSPQLAQNNSAALANALRHVSFSGEAAARPTHSRTGSFTNPVIIPSNDTVSAAQPSDRGRNPGVMFIGAQSPEISNGAPPLKRRRTEQASSEATPAFHQPLMPSMTPQLTMIKYSSFIAKIDHHILVRGGDQAFSSEVEKPRLQLLRDACLHEDGFFLALHQLYCLWSDSPQKIHDYLRLLSPQAIDSAFHIIETVLKKNQQVSSITRAFFVAFPALISNLLQPPTVYQIVLEQVAKFLEKLATVFNRLTRVLLERNYPYLVDELIGHLGCYSPVMQLIFFTACRRRLGVGDGDLGSKMEDIFRDDQRYRRSETTGLLNMAPPSDETYKRNAKVIKLYKHIVAMATSTAPLSTRPSPTLSNGQLTQPQAHLARNQIPTTQARHQAQMAASPYGFANQFPPILTSPQLGGQVQERGASQPTVQHLYGTYQGQPSSMPLLPQYTIAQQYPSIVPGHPTQAREQPQPGVAPYAQQAQLQQLQQLHAEERLDRRIRELNELASHQAQQPSPVMQPDNLAFTFAQFQHPAIAPQPQPILAGHVALPSAYTQPQPVGTRVLRRSTSNGVSPAAVVSPIAGAQVDQILRHPRQLHDRLLPAKGDMIPRTEWPYDPSDRKSLMMSLHQAHARSPKRVMRDADPERFYQAVKSLPVGPTAIAPMNMVQKFQFEVTSDQLLLASTTFRRDGELQPVTEHFNGSLRWRLRCCKISAPDHAVTEQQWTTLDVSWPPNIFMTLNGQALDIRRHSHNGRDLPSELTSFIVLGTNYLHVSLPDLSRESANNRFLAVEMLETLSHSSVVELVWQKGVIPEQETLRTIKQRLSGPSDDDGVFFEAPDLSIDLADPFTSVIFKVPARGAGCSHMECFDLETWLNTRPSKSPLKCAHGQVQCSCPTVTEPTIPDKWRCPICFRDARPYSLRIDGFLLKVRSQLEEQNKLQTKSMHVKPDGTWTVVLEADDGDETDDDDIPLAARKIAAPPTAMRKLDVEVIELD